MGSMRVFVNDDNLYNGPIIAVPRVGDGVRRGEEVERITAVVWDFSSDSDVVAVQLLTGDRPYTF